MENLNGSIDDIHMLFYWGGSIRVHWGDIPWGSVSLRHDSTR